MLCCFCYIVTWISYERESVSLSVMSNSLQPHGLWPSRLHFPWNFSAKNTGVGCYFLIHWIFSTQGLNLHLLHCRWILYHGASKETHLSICVCVSVRVCLVTQLCPTACDLVDCSLPGSSVHGILQARILEWATPPFEIYIYIYIPYCLLKNLFYIILYTSIPIYECPQFVTHSSIERHF